MNANPFSSMLPASLDVETWLFLADLSPRDERDQVLDLLDGWMEAKKILIPEEVLREIESKNEALHERLRMYPGAVISLDEAIESNVRTLLQQFPDLIDAEQIGFQSDVFLVATAIRHKLSIISIRKGWQSVLDRYDIAEVCDEVGVDFQKLPSIGSLLVAQ